MSGNVFDCDICLNGFDEGRRLPKVLPCAHTYCLECLMAVARRDSTCPVCREAFTTYPMELPNNYQIFAGIGRIDSSNTSVERQKLFVARIPSHATEEDLQAVFAQFGEVRETLLIRSLASAGQCKKFGFVTFKSEASAQQALQSRPILFGSTKLVVETAKPKANSMVEPSRETQQWVPPGYPYSHRIFVKWIPRGCSESKLTTAFSLYGAVESVVRRVRQGRHFAIITYVSSDAVDRACRDQVLALPTGQRLHFRRLRECERRTGAPRPQPPRPQPHHQRSERVILTRPDDCCSVQ